RGRSEQAEIGIDARSAMVIIAGAQVDILPEAIGIASYHEQSFAVRFQSDHAIDDVGPGFLELPGPANIGSLVEAGAQFHQSGDLLAVVGGLDQRLDYGRTTAGAIERNLDRQNLRIGCGTLDKADNGIETFVGMMQQNILLAHDLENVGLRRQGRIGCGLERPIFQLGESVVRHQWHEMRHRKRAIELVEVGFLQIEKSEEQVAEIWWTIRFHFQPNGIAAAGTPQFLLNRPQQVFRLFLVNVEIAVAGNAERVHAIEDEPGEKLGDVMFNERGEVNVIPRLVIAFAARHQN